MPFGQTLLGCIKRQVSKDGRSETHFGCGPAHHHHRGYQRQCSHTALIVPEYDQCYRCHPMCDTVDSPNQGTQQLQGVHGGMKFNVYKQDGTKCFVKDSATGEQYSEFRLSTPDLPYKPYKIEAVGTDRWLKLTSESHEVTLVDQSEGSEFKVTSWFGDNNTTTVRLEQDYTNIEGQYTLVHCHSSSGGLLTAVTISGKCNLDIIQSPPMEVILVMCKTYDCLTKES